MEKAIMGLVAALGAAAPLAGAQASVVTPDEANRALRVSSVAELLEPTTNALAVLASLDNNNAKSASATDKGVQTAQWHHHHHHHHHRVWHHHHHHHNHWRWCRFHPFAPQCM